MARAAISGGLKVRRTWRPAVLVERRPETPSASTLVLEVPEWSGHIAGQHVDVRLTAPDGYQAARSYSLATPSDGEQIEITVQAVPDGEVSGYLVGDARVGDTVEVRGPVGGWFVWKPEQGSPVLLVAGGSGVVPLMAMIRSRDGISSAPFRLIYSVRTPEDRIYHDELRLRGTEDSGLTVTFLYTRAAPEEEPRPLGRIGLDDLVSYGWPAEVEPTCYVCGPTPFVETVSDLLIFLGHDSTRIRTERFGPSGS
ncbi:MAG TPA: ferredoxin reductase [Propionibacteriaceae bacterium]|nr:ferredoxin reductase [Propionibacteriaceae bacterium]